MAVFEERSVPQNVVNGIIQWCKDNPDPNSRRKVHISRQGRRSKDPYYVRIESSDDDIALIRREIVRISNRN